MSSYLIIFDIRCFFFCIKWWVHYVKWKTVCSVDGSGCQSAQSHYEAIIWQLSPIMLISSLTFHCWNFNLFPASTDNDEPTVLRASIKLYNIVYSWGGRWLGFSHQISFSTWNNGYNSDFQFALIKVSSKGRWDMIGFSFGKHLRVLILTEHCAWIAAQGIPSMKRWL